MECDDLVILKILVTAHEVPHPNTGSREPIMFLKHFGGSSLQHHALDDDLPDLDEAMVEDLHGQGFLDIDYREHNLNLRPTRHARAVVDEHRRIAGTEPTADVSAIQEAVSAQAESENPMAWPRVRPVLVAIQRYWRESGFSEHGVALTSVLEALPDDLHDLFKATVRGLISRGLLETRSILSASGVPGEIQLSADAHSVLDGWPGATGDQLVENLLAVIAEAIEDEEDPAEKKRLGRLGETLRDVGVATAGDVLARVMTGGP